MSNNFAIVAIVLLLINIGFSIERLVWSRKNKGK